MLGFGKQEKPTNIINPSDRDAVLDRLAKLTKAPSERTDAEKKHVDRNLDPQFAQMEAEKERLKPELEKKRSRLAQLITDRKVILLSGREGRNSEFNEVDKKNLERLDREIGAEQKAISSLEGMIGNTNEDTKH